MNVKVIYLMLRDDIMGVYSGRERGVNGKPEWVCIFFREKYSESNFGRIQYIRQADKKNPSI